MTLSCDCSWELGDYDWYFEVPDKYSVLGTKRRKRCKSCNKLIDIGSTVIEFRRFRYPKNDIEDRIHGGDDAEIPLASMYHCEECADLCFSLEDLGFCVMPEEDQHDLVAEYADMRKAKEL